MGILVAELDQHTLWEGGRDGKGWGGGGGGGGMEAAMLLAC